MAHVQRPFTAHNLDQNLHMSARQVLARNLTVLMTAYPEIGSQKLLFKSTGVTTSTIGRIRRGEVSATLDNIEALAKAFKITVGDLLNPSLPETLDKLTPIDLRAEAMAIADEIVSSPLTSAQLQILKNTVAALKC